MLRVNNELDKDIMDSKLRKPLEKSSLSPVSLDNTDVSINTKTGLHFKYSNNKENTEFDKVLDKAMEKRKKK